MIHSGKNQCTISPEGGSKSTGLGMYLAALLVVASLVGYAQTGPGGVGNADGSGGQPTNVIWLDANSLNGADGIDIASWPDLSGNDNDLGTSTGDSDNSADPPINSNPPGTPVLKIGTDFQYLEFEADEHDRLVRRNFNGFPNLNATSFVVFRTNNSGEALVSYAIDEQSNEYLVHNTSNLSLFIEGQERNPGTSFNDGSWQLLATRWQTDGTATLHKAGTGTTVNSFNNGRTISDGGALAIGGEQDRVDDSYATNQDFEGDIAEVIIYDAYLNDVQRIIVENYLSAKYGLTLSSGDYYAGDDDNITKNYDRGVLGIGQLAGSAHTQASSEGLVLDTLGTELDTDDEFIFAGHKTATNTVVTTNLSGSLVSRWNRTWYLDKTTSGSLGAIVGFDFSEGISGQFPQDKDGYELVRFNGSSYEVVSVAANDKYVSGDKIYFRVADSDLVDGVYTLGTTDATVSPLEGGPNKTWYSYATGDWEDFNTWTLDGGNPARFENDDDEVPRPIDNIVITNNKTVTITSDNLSSLSLEVNSGAQLDVAATQGHNFNEIRSDGTGRIIVAGNGGVDNFPAGDVSGSNGFADATNGGTLTIKGGGITLDQPHSFRHVELNMDATASTATLLANYTINGNLIIKRGTWQFNDGAMTTDLTVQVQGDVTVEGNGAMSVSTANARHQFDVYGDFVNNGTATFTNRPDFATEVDREDHTNTYYTTEAANGIVDVNFLKASQNQELQCNGPTRFYRIEIDKGVSKQDTLFINADQAGYFSLLGAANYGHASLAQLDDTRSNDNQRNINALGLYRGTVRIGTNVNIPVLSTTGNYNISAAASLSVAGGRVLKNNGSAIVPYGTVHINSGLLEARITNGITMRDNGLIRVDGGEVNVNQIRTSILGSNNVGGYVQTAGDVTLLGNSTQADYYVFCLTFPGNVFTMSGGTLTIEESRGKGGIFINSDPANVNVTEGTVNFEIGNNSDFVVTSRAPFWNVNMRNTASNTNKVVLGAAVDVSSSYVNVDAQPLVVLNNFTIEANTLFDHQGNDVTIGRNFTIQQGGVYFFGSGTEDPNSSIAENLTAPLTHQNTTTFNGAANAIITFNHLTTEATGVEQVFHNVVVDKPSGVQVSIRAPNKNTNGNNNNIFRTLRDGSFTLRSGTFDQGINSARFYGPVTNYDTLGVFKPGVTRNNALLKFRPRDFTIETTPEAVFGNFKLNNGNRVITFATDVEILRMEYRHGRINIGTHNLRINYLDVDLEGGADYDNCNGCFSVQDMIITAGNASDGGLTLRIPADGKNPINESVVETGNGGQVNPAQNFADRRNGNRNFPNAEFSDDVFLFPLGIRQSTSGNGSETQDQFTPLVIDLGTVDVGTDGEGFITVNPVAETLSTTDQSGGNILNYYWRIRTSSFEAAPQVNTIRAFGYNRDLNAASTVTDGPDATYTTSLVSGGVLDAGAFQRFDDEEAAINPNITGFSTELPGGPDFEILFNGNAVLGDPAPFLLQDANFTFGDPNRFVGAPEVYYTRRDGNWNNRETWSTEGHYGSRVGAGVYPQDGDIAIIGFDPSDAAGNSSHWLQLNIDVNVAEIVFAKTVRNSSGDEVPRVNSWLPQLVVRDERGAIDLGKISGEGTFNVEVGCSTCSTTDPSGTTVRVATITADFGDFANEEESRFDYDLVNNAIFRLPTSFPEVYPNVHVKGKNQNNNRVLIIPEDIEIRRDLIIRQDAVLRLNDGAEGDITTNRNVDFTINNGDDIIEFPTSGTARTLRVEGDIIMDDGTDRIQVRNNTPSDLEHSLQVGGDIVQSGGNVIDLYNGNSANANHAILELIGNTSGQYTRTSGTQAELYRIVMNKGANQDFTFTFANDFSLNGPTNGATKALELQNGRLVLDDSAIDINLTTGGGSVNPFQIPASAALDIQQGTVRASGDDSGILLDGLMRLGSANARALLDGTGNGNNYIQYSASGNATLEVIDGELRVGSQIRRGLTASNGSLNYIQSGGMVTVGVNAAPEDNRGVFELTSGDGSSFIHTGGNLIIARDNGNASSIASLYLDPDNSFVANDAIITLGNVSTPAGQTIQVNASISLNDLTVDNSAGNSVTGQNVERTLRIMGDFTNDAGATFDGNGQDFYLTGNFTNDGIYTANGNNTIFDGSSAQALAGSGTNDFFDFSKENGGTLTLSQGVLVNNDLFVLGGVLADGGNTVEVKGDLTLDATHTSAGGNGILLSGTAQQNIRRSTAGEGFFGMLSINNTSPSGVVIVENNGYDFTVANGLRLESGTFNIGSSLLTVATNADIVPVNDFGSGNMIRTNSSFNDSGVRKLFSAGVTTDFVFPVGEDVYSPVLINLGASGSTSGSSAGAITIIPSASVITVVNDGVENTSPSDLDNVLQYYWNVEATGLTNFTSDIIFTYDQSDVSIGLFSGYTEADYIPARVLTNSGDINKFSETLLNEGTNQITFNFTGVDQNGISGDYFAGVSDAIPDDIPIYHTTNTGGNYALGGTWEETVPVGGPSGSIIVVRSGAELAVTTNRINAYRMVIEDGGTLDVGATTQHAFGRIQGTGTIRTESDVLPAGNYQDFLVCSGGGLEYAGATDYGVLSGITELRRVVFSGSGLRTLPGADLRICEDMVVDGPTVDNQSDVNITIDRDAILSAGAFNTGSNSNIVTARDLTLNGGNYQGESSHTNTIGRNMAINTGAFTAGNNAQINISGNLSMTAGTGSFTAGAGSALVRMQGSTAQIISGDFSGAAAFNRLEVANTSGLSLLGNTNVGRELLLTNGIITAPAAGNKFKLASDATATPTIGKATSFVNGRLYKDISGGITFTFPVGKSTRWGYATVDPQDATTREWNVEYFDASPETIGLINFNFTSSDADVESLSRNEYWRIEDSPSGATALVGLMWDGSSDVSASSTDWYALTVMGWNESTETWDNHRGTGHESNPSPSTSHGFFTSTVPISFSTRYVTLGSTEANNALPVELISFKAVAQEQTVQLTWETASEINNDYFEVLRSVDGISFKKIGEVAGNGTTSERMKYEFTDKLPLAGVAYYQLKQVDYNGMYEYSDKVSVEWISTGEYAAFVELNLYPNPSPQGEAKLRVTGLRPRSAATVKLLDMFGKVHLQQVIEADRLSEEGYMIRPRARLSAGVYVVSVQQGSQIHQKTLIVR